MFTTEQHIIRKRLKRSETRLLRSGMTLVKPVVVKNRFTYRELTLVLGIFVALIVAITVWSSKKNQTVRQSGVSVSTSVVERSLQELIKKSAALVTSAEF